MSFTSRHFMGVFFDNCKVRCYRPMRKREREIATAAYCRYMHEKHKTLFDAYKKPSTAKAAIWKGWLNICEKAGTKSVSVISANCHFFTLGFIVTCDARDYFVYVTPTNQYFLDITRAWEVEYNDNGHTRVDRFPFLDVSDLGVYNFASEAINGIAYVSLALTRDQMISLKRVSTIEI